MMALIYLVILFFIGVFVYASIRSKVNKHHAKEFVAAVRAGSYASTGFVVSSAEPVAVSKDSATYPRVIARSSAALFETSNILVTLTKADSGVTAYCHEFVSQPTGAIGSFLSPKSREYRMIVRKQVKTPAADFLLCTNGMSTKSGPGNTLPQYKNTIPKVSQAFNIFFDANDEASIVKLLTDNAETLAQYPHYEFEVHNNKLYVATMVDYKNTGQLAGLAELVTSLADRL